MALTINTNIASLNAQRNLSQSQSALSVSMERLSSGLRINSAKDDAAGLAISDRMTAQINGLEQAAENANDGISLAQTAEGALDETTEILQRIRELAVQSANDTNSAADRESLQAEVNQLIQEMDRIAETTSFNGKTLLDGTMTSAQFQVGANSGETISFSISSAETTSLGIHKLSADETDATVSMEAAVSGATTNNVDAQTLTINGSYGTATVAVATGDSAATITDSINAVSDDTGVSASANTTATLSTVSADGTVSFNLTGTNEDAVTVTASVESTDLTNLVEAINDAASQTGITAELSSDKKSITLTQSAGEDIVIEDFTHSTSGSSMNVTGNEKESSSTAVTLTDGTTTSACVGGEITIVGDSTFTITSDTTDAGVFSAASGDINVSALESVNTIDISTVDGAEAAIDIVDGAISQIDSIRGGLGAVQNRFESTIANLENVAENLSAARSQILDADIAAETSEMTKQNILQQAGVSVLTQANTTPELALQLLQG